MGGFRLSDLGLLLGAFTGIALLQLGPALSGPFLFDDHALVLQNRFVHELSLGNLVAIFDPTGDAARVATGYKPVNLLLHALQWQLFADAPGPYHVTNVLLHALGSVGLVILFAGWGLPRAVAVVAGGLFLVHPAQVEAVAWISQLKTTATFVLSLAVLGLHPRRPGWASLCFLVALLTKLQAAFVLPVVLVHDFVRGRLRATWPWLVAWGVLLAAYASAEVAVTLSTAAAGTPLSEDPFEWIRSVAAIAGRYAAMAATGLGTAPFHEPGPARSWLDPWWLGALGLLACVAWRVAAGVRERRVELVYWTWAGASFLPVSQIIPFHYPMADRYLYFILPGLLGAVACLAVELHARLAPRAGRAFALAGGAAVLVLGIHFTLAGHALSRIWRHPDTVMDAAMQAYPDSQYAYLRRATLAGQQGDVDGVVRELRGARERGFSEIFQLATAPQIDVARSDPRFRALLEEVAREWVDRLGDAPDLTQTEARYLGVAYWALGRRDEAEAVLRRALERGGPYASVLEADLGVVRQRRLYPDHP